MDVHRSSLYLRDLGVVIPNAAGAVDKSVIDRSPADPRPAVPGEYIVKFKSGVSTQAVRALAIGGEGRVIRKLAQPTDVAH